jgi:hypothetical protein
MDGDENLLIGVAATQLADCAITNKLSLLSDKPSAIPGYHPFLYVIGMFPFVIA